MVRSEGDVCDYGLGSVDGDVTDGGPVVEAVLKGDVVGIAVVNVDTSGRVVDVYFHRADASIRASFF